MENTETRVWLDFALAYKYVPKEIFDDFNKRSEEIRRLLKEIVSQSCLNKICFGRMGFNGDIGKEML